MPHKVRVSLSSRDKQRTDDTPQNCHLKIGNYGVKNVTEICLEQFVIPNTIYNIKTGENDKFVFRRSSTNYSYTIPAGQ